MKTARRIVLALIITAPLVLGLGAADGGGWYVFAGPSFSDLSIPVVSGEKDYRLGFLAGLGYEAPLNGAFSLLVQGAYTSGGTHVDMNDGSEVTYSGSAVTVPVMLRIKLGRSVAPFLTAGGYAGWMFSPRMEIDSGGSSSEMPISGDDVSPFLYGVTAGLGIEFRIGTAGLFVHALYGYGLSDLDKTGTAEVRPSSLNLLAGLRF